MIRKVFTKELKEILRDGRFRLSFVLVFILLSISIVIGSKQYTSVNEQYELAKSAERELWDNQGEKNPHSAAHYGTYAFKPKYPLSLLDQGVDKYEGVSIFMEAHNRNEAQYSEAGDQSGLARFGELSPDFILLFILPLLIIIMGYNSYTKEKEGGTYVLLKSQGVSGWKLAFGKLIALYTPVFISCSLLFLTAAILLSGLEDYGVFSLSALGLMFLIYLLYYLIFSQVVLFISSKARNSGISLVTALSFWIVACLIAPKAAANFAETKDPYPTRQAFSASIAAAKKGGLDGHNPWNKEAKLLEAKVLKEHGVDSLAQLPFNFDAYRMQKSEEHEAKIYFDEYSKLKDQFQKQTNTYKWVSFFSPFLPTRFVSMGIAQTDYESHWNFSDAVESYRIETQQFLNGNFAKNSKYGEWGYSADADFWKKLPPFEYRTASLMTVMERQKGNFGILFVWILLSGLLLFVSTKKI